MKTWRKYNTYKRVQSLWTDYKEVAQTELSKSDGRLVLVSQKLSAFLEAFQSAYHEFKSEFSKSSSSSSLNAFYGDCSELLLSLLELVDRHAMDAEELAAEKARLAQHEEASNGAGRTSPAEVATKVKGMVSKASGSVDAKLVDRVRQNTEKLTTHAGAALSSPEAMSKLAGWTQQASDPEVAYHIAETVSKALTVAELIIREEKYRGIATIDAPQVTKRLLSLLENVKSPEAKKIALRMIGVMAQSMECRLEICRLDGYRKVLRVLQESPDHLGKEAMRTLSHLIEAHDSEAAAAGADAPPRFKKVVQNAATKTEEYGIKFALNPSTIWSTTKAAVAQAHKYMGGQYTEPTEDMDANSDCASMVGDERVEFPLSHISVARRIEEVELEVKELFEMEPSPLERNLTPRAFADFLATEHMQGDGLDDELMKEIMGVQGALTTLTSKLAEAARDVKLDLMSTISKLLRNSKRNQREFKNIEGYGFLREMLDSISDYQSPASLMFLKDVFGIMQSIILDGTPEKAVKNLDALELVLRLVSSDCHLEVRRRAVLCVQELLIMNALNVVCVRRVSGFDSLLQGIIRLQMPKGMEGAVLASRAEYRLMEEIRETLSYSAVLLSRHDYDLVEDILNMAMSQQRIHPAVRLQLLNCASDLLRDRNSRKLSGLSRAITQNIITTLRLVLQNDVPQNDVPLDMSPDASLAREHLKHHIFAPASAHSCHTAGTTHSSPQVELAYGYAKVVSEVLSQPAASAAAAGSDGRLCSLPAPSGDEAGWSRSGGKLETSTTHAPGNRDVSTTTAQRSPACRGGQEEEETSGTLVHFIRSSMGQRSTKDNAFIILLEALAHLVSLDVKPPDDKQTRCLDSFAKMRSFSVDKPLQFEALGGFDMLSEAILSDLCESVLYMSYVT